MSTAISGVLNSRLAVPALVAGAAVPCCLAFKRRGYVFSVGYGLAAATCGGVVLAGGAPTAAVAAHAAGAVAYGLRLAGHLIHRERVAPELYVGPFWEVQPLSLDAAKKTVPLVVACSTLYGAMLSPLAFHFAGAAAALSPIAARVVGTGLALQWSGLALEAAADAQKDRAKGKAAGKGKFVSSGLFARSRHPNYLGELMFWGGVFLAGAPAFSHWGHWVTAGLGLVGISFVMSGATKRLDKKQADKYGADPAYQRYVAGSNALLPKLF